MTSTARIVGGLAIVLCAGGLVGTTAASAEAAWPGWGGQWYGYWAPSVYVQDHVPYYAAHPPVYYTVPTARPYGWSPYPLPPGTLPAEVVVKRPAVVYNPFVETVQWLSAGGPNGQVAPLVIDNPFVKQ